MRTFLLFIILIMLLTVMLGFSPGTARFLFAGGSDGLMELVTSSLVLRVVIVALFCLSVMVYILQKKKKIFLLFPVVFFILWIISGKMIAIFPDGRLRSGWFFMEIRSVNICEGQADCEQVSYYETTVTALSFYRIRVKNNTVDAVILTTPFIRENVLKLLREHFPAKNKN
ncbi:hypothetical protein [Niabella sp.]|uniref:hypothetical protein n=1 Tax=Niabella sp. TaxID=1962976 RepID=UPI002623968F|nr:hypothetical protein [Niabella sp.]